MRTLIETDSRRRVSLAKLGIEADSLYLAERRADGSILLIPAEVRPKVLDIVDRVIPDWRDAAGEAATHAPSSTFERLKAERQDPAP